MRILRKPAMCAAAAPMKVLPVPISPTTVVPRWCFEGEDRAPDGVLLRAQGSAEQAWERAPVLRGPVEGRVRLDHPTRNGVLELVYELSEVHGVSPFFREPHGTSGARLLREAASGGPGAGRNSPTTGWVCA